MLNKHIFIHQNNKNNFYQLLYLLTTPRLAQAKCLIIPDYTGAITPHKTDIFSDITFTLSYPQVKLCNPLNHLLFVFF